MNKKNVICVGEALIDRIRNKSNQGFTDFLGGAPANVACALRKLKIDSIFIGSLGSDDYGKKFITQFNELDVNLDFLQLDNDLSTRVVNVGRSELGERFFSGFEASSYSCFADEALSKKFDSISCSNSFFFVSNSFISLIKESFFVTRSLKTSLEISSKDFFDLSFFRAIFLFCVVFFLLISLGLSSEIDLSSIDAFSGLLFEISVFVI